MKLSEIDASMHPSRRGQMDEIVPEKAVYDVLFEYGYIDDYGNFGIDGSLLGDAVQKLVSLIQANSPPATTEKTDGSPD